MKSLSEFKELVRSKMIKVSHLLDGRPITTSVAAVKKEKIDN